jgi:hypothetical protein
MNREIMIQAGFEETVAMVEAGLCPFCGRRVDKSDFKDGLSEREYRISGLCQECQDNTFGG